MEEEKCCFSKSYDSYVDELQTSCKVFSLDGHSLECEAIWDTGAECTVLSREVAKKLSLTVYSKEEMFHAGGSTISNTYHVFVGLTDEIIIGPQNVIEGQFDGNVILLGMDVIGNGDLVVTNNEEHTEMVFSIPSTLKMEDIKKLL